MGAPEDAERGEPKARDAHVLDGHDDVDGREPHNREQAVAQHGADSVDVDGALGRQQVRQQVHEEAREHAEAVDVAEVHLGGLSSRVQLAPQHLSLEQQQEPHQQQAHAEDEAEDERAGQVGVVQDVLVDLLGGQ